MLSVINHKNGQVKDVEYTLFPGGEVNLSINSPKMVYSDPGGVCTIHAKCRNMNDAFGIALLKDAIQHMFRFDRFNLFLPYVPYARQDRVCSVGEARSLKVFADYINHLNFDTVVVVDPHSDVVENVVNNVHVITQFEVLTKHFHQFNGVDVCKGPNAIFVSPDAGSNKKTAKLAGYFGHPSFIRADKLRDLQTGKILETIVYADDLTGKDVIICDDICDGGKTFIELATVLKAKKAKTVTLYVTHGIFSKGIPILKEGGIDRVFTTNSILTAKEYLPLKEKDGVKIIDIDDFIKPSYNRYD